MMTLDMRPGYAVNDRPNSGLVNPIFSRELRLRNITKCIPGANLQNLCWLQLRVTDTFASRMQFRMFSSPVSVTSRHPFRVQPGVVLVPSGSGFGMQILSVAYATCSSTLPGCILGIVQGSSEEEVSDVRAASISDIADRVPCIARVAYVQIVRDRAIHNGPCDAGCGVILMLQTKGTVSAIEASRQPQPTLIRPPHVNLRPESLDVLLGKCNLSGRHSVPPAATGQTVRVASRSHSLLPDFFNLTTSSSSPQASITGVIQ